jgi:hypothetical protein
LKSPRKYFLTRVGRSVGLAGLLMATALTTTSASPAGAGPLPSTPFLTTKGSIFEKDDSTTGPDGNTQLAGANQNVTSFPQNHRLTVFL